MPRMNTTASDSFERFGHRTIDVTTFEHDVTPKVWAEKYRVGDLQVGPIYRSPSRR